MTLQIHNSLTRRKEPFEPITPPKVLFYNCGPTVYGEFHIGNARNFVVFDAIRRWLLARGYEVRYVQNITDVDDKIIARASEEGLPPEDIAEKYTAYFLRKLEELGNLPADDHPKATQHIGPMIGLVKKLIERGHAYPSGDGSVWFEVGSFPDYGKLSGMPLESMQQGDRLDPEQQKLKRSPLDFCLWKAAKEGEPAWKSPWGQGRPGWHLECSCMSMKSLAAETIDIHGGGVDLRFPHHENEIAQSECATGKPFARYWIHNGMLDIDGEKMSKSLGNMRTIDDVLAVVDPLTLRYFLLSARYRDKLDFTEDNLHKCRSAVDRMVAAAREAAQVIRGQEADGRWREMPELVALWEDFAAGMDDDFNTPRAFGALAQLVTWVNKARSSAATSRGSTAALAGGAALLAEMRGHLGLGENLEPAGAGITPEMAAQLESLLAELNAPDDAGEPAAMVEALLRLRADARKAKDFARADAVRARLGEIGIALEDKPGGTVWKTA